LNGNGYAGRILGINLIFPDVCDESVKALHERNALPAQRIVGVNFHKHNTGAPILSSKMCCGIPALSKVLKNSVTISVE